MAIRVEFFGLARQRAGISQLDLELPAGNTPLADVLRAIAREAPQLAGEWIVNGKLHSALAANLGGQQFVSDPATLVRDGQSLLILSADAGG